MADKIDSNITGLRYAEEASLRVLPGTGGADAVWWPLEPNSYSDFGGQLATIARNPINPTRQRKKGVISDLDASGGFNQDFTISNSRRLLQGFFFADAHEKATNFPLNGAPVDVTSVTAADNKYNTAAAVGTWLAGDLLLAQNFGVTANNGLKVVVSGDTNDVTVAASPGLTDEASPPATAMLTKVGHQFAAGDLSVALNGNRVRLESAALDMTTLGLTEGEWIYIGGDAALTQFDDNGPGFGRVVDITADYIELDKTTWTGVVEAGGAKTIQLFYGSFVRNEPDEDDIVRRTYNVERTLGRDDDGVMSEYLVGAVPNELGLNVAQADKVNMDLSFVAVDNEQRTGATGVKPGTRETIPVDDAFNTSSDFARIKLSLVDPTDSNPSPLFAFATELAITINNNVTPNKAIGVLGAFDTSAGTFEVGGSITAYFASIDAVQAVRNNADVTIDLIAVKNNTGFILDVPLLSLGDGRLNVEQDQAITLPLETNAAESSFGYTALLMFFPYLPDVAA